MLTVTEPDLLLPADAFREINPQTLAGWNAHAFEIGRTCFTQAGVEVVDPDHQIVVYASYVLDEAPDDGKTGLAGVAADAWLLVICLLRERNGAERGRVLEVRSSAFQAQPLSAPNPLVMRALYDGAERYVAKRAAQGLPVGISLHAAFGYDGEA